MLPAHNPTKLGSVYSSRGNLSHFFQANSSLVVGFFRTNSSLKLIHDVKKVDSFTDKNAKKEFVGTLKSCKIVYENPRIAFL